jgi:hypothetical protein
LRALCCEAIYAHILALPNVTCRGKGVGNREKNGSDLIRRIHIEAPDDYSI